MDKWNKRQMEAVLSLAVPPRYQPDYEIKSFAVDSPWTTGHIWVRRIYGRPGRVAVQYVECFVVGPRGSIKLKTSYIQ